MKKRFYFLVALLSFLSINSAEAQICLGQSITTCPGQPVTISALCNGSGGSPVFLLDSMQQVFLTDDQYSGVINIGFPFTYYGVVYNQLVIASNNYVTFDLSQANGYSPWSISAPIPSPALPTNSIMGPYQDINPGLGGTIEYGVLGTAPNRKFVVRYNQVPMFSCSNDLFCSTLMLYEGTNHIEIYIDNKPLCPTWNSGVAIEGVQNATGTIASVVPGRNFPTQWTATADGVQIYPTTPTNYSVTSVPYIPSLLASGIQWWDTDGNFLGTGFQITVTPTNDTTGYYVVYDQCYTASGGSGNTDTAWVYTTQPSLFATATDINCVDTFGTATAMGIGLGPLIYQWNDPMNQVGPVAFNLNAGTYIVTAIDTNGCTAQAVATVDSLFYTLTPGSTDALCNGDNNGTAFVDVLSSIGTTGTISYQWDVNAGNQITDTATGLAAGNYMVVITDSLGCSDSTTITVNEPLGFTVTDTIINPTCAGMSNGSIMVNVSGATPGYTYSWGSNQLTGLAAGSYPITITDTNNCNYLDTFLITDPLAVDVTLDTISASCGLNDGYVFAFAQGGTPGYTYNWTPGGLGPDTLSNVSTGNYAVLVTDINGCTDTASIFVNQIPGFDVGFTLSPSQGTVPLTVSFFDNSNNCVTYFWDFGNGNTSNSNAPNPEIYQTDGTYTVTLVACNAGGCCDTASNQVFVESHSHCGWGKIFTPNGDGMNDEFEIVCDRIADFEIVIFNRWGNIMFESNDISNSWDGTKNGKDVPEGTYFFIFKAKGTDGQTWDEKGSLTLMR